MTFAFRLSRGLSLGALAACITLGSVSAQNGTNYHVLTNDGDYFYGGVGAGGTQTATDGLMTVIAGEDLRGSHRAGFSADWSYRSPVFRETVCVMNFLVPGAGFIRFPLIAFLEMDGLNGNVPAVFTNPACQAGAQFPMGTSGFIPYGTGPGSSFSLVLFTVPSGLQGSGFPSGAAMLAPNNGIVPSSAGGTAAVIGAGFGSLPITQSGGCWAVQFSWVGTNMTTLDDVDSLVHYMINSGDGNQYHVFSGDEINIWQSWTMLTDAGQTTTFAWLPSGDYCMLMSTVEPNTHAALATVGDQQQGPYYLQTENVGDETGFVLNPNGGFDVGRGSRVLSLSGTAGVANPVTGLGNQNPTTLGKTSTLGFATWDGGGDGDGSVRLAWVSVDYQGLFGLPADGTTDVIKPFYDVRLPTTWNPALPGQAGAFPQDLTTMFWKPLLLGGIGMGHITAVAPSGWPDAGGLASGAFGVPAIGGASIQLPTAGTLCASVVGIPVNLTYGTTGRKDGPGGLTFNPAIADLSGSKELFLID